MYPGVVGSACQWERLPLPYTEEPFTRLLKASKLACGPSENLRISLLNDRLLVVVLKIETPILYRFAKRCIFMDCKFNAIFLASIVVKLAYLPPCLHPFFVFLEAGTHVGGLFTRGVRVTHDSGRRRWVRERAPLRLARKKKPRRKGKKKNVVASRAEQTTNRAPR